MFWETSFVSFLGRRSARLIESNFRTGTVMIAVEAVSVGSVHEDLLHDDHEGGRFWAARRLSAPARLIIRFTTLSKGLRQRATWCG